MDATKAVVGPGWFHADYIDFGARELGEVTPRLGAFDSLVEKLLPEELIILGDIASTVVVESKSHFDELALIEYPPSFFYAVKQNGPLNRIMTTDDSQFNAEQLSRLMKEKRSNGLFDYVRKEAGSKERRSG